MIPDDEQISHFFATALPATELVRVVMRGSGSIDGICGERVPTADIILRWLRLSSRSDTKSLTWQAWIDEQNLSKSDYMAFAASPQRKDTLASWVQRCVGERSFAVALTRMEEIDEVLAYTVARYLHPVVQQQKSLTPITVGCFIGRYNYTPLGIHRDEHITASVHFHLGPGPKELWFWRNDKNLPPDASALPFSEAVALAESVSIGVGDGLSIAYTDTHVGRAAGLCVNLVLLFKNLESAKLIEQVRKDLMWFRKEPVQWGESAPANGFAPESWLHLTVEQMYNTALELWRMALASNGGLEASPIPRTGGLAKQAKVRITKADVFPLLFQESHGQLVVAARGRLRAWTLHSDMTDWLDRLASGVAVSLVDIQCASKNKAVLGDMTMCLIWLYQMRVLDVEAQDK